MAASITISSKDDSPASSVAPPAPLQAQPKPASDPAGTAPQPSEAHSTERDVIKAAREIRRRTKRRKDKTCLRLADSEQLNAWALDADTERSLLRKAAFTSKKVAQRRSIKGDRLTVTRKTVGSHARKHKGRHRDRSVAGEF